MFPGMNKKQMAQAMRQMGISQEEINAVEVIIRCPDKELVFHSPEVSIVKMAGQESFQISGDYEERSLSTTPEINEEDIKMVAQQANVSEEEAKTAIEESNGDLAAAILKLQK